MTGYRITTGMRKALWAVVYLAAACAVEQAIIALKGSPELAAWVLTPVVVGVLTVAGNYLKYKREG